MCPGSEILTSTQTINILKEKRKPFKKTCKKRTRSSSSSDSEDQSSPLLMDSDNSEGYLNELVEEDVSENND